MFKLWASILKDMRVLTRDRIGLVLMFAMPIILVVVITSIQNNTFKLVNENKIPVLVINKDTGEASYQLREALETLGMFTIVPLEASVSTESISEIMEEEDALLAILIPENFTEDIKKKANNITDKVMYDFGLTEDETVLTAFDISPLTLYYHPVLQESFRYSIHGALGSVLQIVENKQILQALYMAISDEELPKDLEDQLLNNRITINEKPASKIEGRVLPNATQHNVPAWTIFAMFFMVISLGTNIVREKNSGSFIRLKILPTNFLLGMVSKQLVYLVVSLLQVAVIFSLGLWFFPLIGLPELFLPQNLLGLLLVSLMCGWCALSYALCIGVFANTQEQANGFGAVSVVILAAIGGILVPSFAMPGIFRFLMVLSPLHWCLESYYSLFLYGDKFKDVWENLLPLLGITLSLQLLAIYGLKRQNLI